MEMIFTEEIVLLMKDYCSPISKRKRLILESNLNRLIAEENLSLFNSCKVSRKLDTMPFYKRWAFKLTYFLRLSHLFYSRNLYFDVDIHSVILQPIEKLEVTITLN